MKEFDPVIAVFRRYSPTREAIPTEETAPLQNKLWELFKFLERYHLPSWKLYQYIIVIINRILTFSSKEDMVPEIASHVTKEKSIVDCVSELYDICHASPLRLEMLWEIQKQFSGSLLCDAGEPLLVIQRVLPIKLRK